MTKRKVVATFDKEKDPLERGGETDDRHYTCQTLGGLVVVMIQNFCRISSLL